MLITHNSLNKRVGDFLQSLIMSKTRLSSIESQPKKVVVVVVVIVVAFVVFVVIIIVGQKTLLLSWVNKEYIVIVISLLFSLA